MVTESTLSPAELQGFTTPDWAAPIDIAPYLEQHPPEGTSKGMFFHSLVDLARAKSGRAPGRERYVAFRDYPLSEYLEVIYGCAELAFPDASMRQALRLLGKTVYPTLASSVLGRVLFKFAGNDLGRALRALPRAYELFTTARAEVVPVEERSAIVKLRNTWDFVDTYQVGVLEGGMEALGHVGTVELRSLSLCDADFKLTWL